ILLASSRRHSAKLIAALDALEPADDPVAAAWGLLVEMSVKDAHVEDLTLWVRASSGAPEVRDRAAGERSSVVSALTDYFARSLTDEAGDDLRPFVLAAALHSVNRAVLSFWTQHGQNHDLEALFSDALRSLGTIDGTP